MSADPVREATERAILRERVMLHALFAPRVAHRVLRASAVRPSLPLVIGGLLPRHIQRFRCWWYRFTLGEYEDQLQRQERAK